MPGNSESSFFNRMSGVLPIWSSSEDAGAATGLGKAGAIRDTLIVPNLGQHQVDFRHLLVRLTSGNLDARGLTSFREAGYPLAAEDGESDASCLDGSRRSLAWAAS